MSDFKTFLSKYAGEISGVGQALATVIAGVALPSGERDVIISVVDKLDTAAHNILGGLDNVNDSVTIAEQDIEAALAKVVPANLQALVNAAVETAVAEAMAKLSPPAPTSADTGTTNA